MHAKLHVHQTVMVGTNLHCLIYHLLIAIGLLLHILISVNSENMLNTKGLVTLTEYHQVS